ncbi:hypothetical protein PG993_002917 [Apiospora rasikravindrae]|uniref:NACHT domain-containing protein n=1 Tax=Apiospora rasikravindrae TaxID=990691 RepID=A0ABR1TYF7_9PEZI
MDAFAALGSAANTCQFLEYSFKILNQVKAVRNAGAVNPDLERDTRYLTEVSGKLAHKAPGNRDLGEIASHCTSLSRQLLDELSKTKPKDSRSKWQSFKAVESAQPADDRLDETQLTECFVESRETSEKLSTITKNGHALQSDVLTIRDSLDRLRPNMEAQYIGKDTSEMVASFVNRTDEALNRVKQISILNLVRFPGVHERFDLIEDAHEGTFNWLLDDGSDQPISSPGSQGVSVNGENDDNSEGKTILSASKTGSTNNVCNEALAETRKSFLSWLQSDCGAFWITGKPGAGKSTLMKYICLHENLNRYLNVWATGSGLTLGKFFFWKPGTEAQKSIQGLFRGLIFSVLERSPDLIPTAFPDLWDMAGASAAAMPAGLRANNYKFAFFIDGLDEFEGRHLELLQELNHWMTAYPNHVKCCVSSREHKRDIYRSVEHRLSRIPRHLRLSYSGMEIIQETVAQKAEGVLLWVSLVLGAVEDGLFSGDSVPELVDRIKHCPTELEALFEQLLRSIHPADRKFAFSALSWVLYIPRHKEAAGNSVGVPLWGSAASNLSLVELLSVEATENELWRKQFNVECNWETFIHSSCRKVYGKCKGLLEVRGELNTRKSMLESHVALTHRSVVEFLDTIHACTFMGQYNQEFDPFQATMKGLLALLKYNTSQHFSWDFSNTWLSSCYNDPDIKDSLMRIATRAEPNYEVHRYAYLLKSLHHWPPLTIEDSKLHISSSMSARRYTCVMSKFSHLGCDLNRVYKERREPYDWLLHSKWTLWKVNIWNMLTYASHRRSKDGASTFGHIVDQLLRMGADANLTILTSEETIKESEVAWLTPTTGWICFRLFSGTYLPAAWEWATACTHHPGSDVYGHLLVESEKKELGHLFLSGQFHSLVGFATFHFWLNGLKGVMITIVTKG